MKKFTFDDVLLVQGWSEIPGRDGVDLSISRSGLPKMGLGVITANMDTITGVDMARATLDYGAQSCLHRFSTIEENVIAFQESCLDNKKPIVSVGITSGERARAEALFHAGAEYIVIDVAHGAQLSVLNQAKFIRQLVKGNASILVGNFGGTRGISTFLEKFKDIDGIKAGIGPSPVCSTRTQTGVGYPQLSNIIDLYRVTSQYGIALIADGGMKNPGDIAKAFAAGADAIMAGSMVAGTDETPPAREMRKAFNEWSPNEQDSAYRGHAKLAGIKYRGSASSESYQAQGKTGSHRTHEGTVTTVEYKGPVRGVLQNIEGGLRSSFTYAGASNLEEFRKMSEMVEVSVATMAENKSKGSHK